MKEQIDLKLFIDFPSAYLEEGVASALQSFETAIYCIALRRWPATVELLWQANELLLRHLYRKTMKDWSTIDAMEVHSKDGTITSDLSDAAHKLRKTRNDFVHSGFSPKDDHLSIKRYFEAGVPYFANLFETAFKLNLYDFYGTGTTGKWFWNVYKNTRKLITSPDTSEENSISRTWLFVLSCHKVVTVGGRFEGALLPYNHYEYHLMDNHQDTHFDIDIEIIKDFVSNSLRSSPDDTTWLKVECEICGSELLGNCTWGESDQFVELNGFGCAKCGYVFNDPNEVKCFIGGRVFGGAKQVSISDVEFVEDRLYF